MATRFMVVEDDREERSITDSVFPLEMFDTKEEAELFILQHEEENYGPLEDQFVGPAYFGWLSDRLSDEDKARLSPAEKEDLNDIFAVFVDDSPNDPYPEFSRFYRLWELEVPEPELWTLTSDLDHFEVHGNFTTVELAKEFAASVADEPIEWEEELVISRDARISFTVYMGGTERFEISPSVTNPTPINKEPKGA